MPSARGSLSLYSLHFGPYVWWRFAAGHLALGGVRLPLQSCNGPNGPELKKINKTISRMT